MPLTGNPNRTTGCGECQKSEKWATDFVKKLDASVKEKIEFIEKNNREKFEQEIRSESDKFEAEKLFLKQQKENSENELQKKDAELQELRIDVRSSNLEFANTLKESIAASEKAKKDMIQKINYIEEKLEQSNRDLAIEQTTIDRLIIQIGNYERQVPSLYNQIEKLESELKTLNQEWVDDALESAEKMMQLSDLKAQLKQSKKKFKKKKLALKSKLKTKNNKIGEEIESSQEQRQKEICDLKKANLLLLDKLKSTERQPEENDTAADFVVADLKKEIREQMSQGLQQKAVSQEEFERQANEISRLKQQLVETECRLRENEAAIPVAVEYWKNQFIVQKTLATQAVADYEMIKKENAHNLNVFRTMQKEYENSKQVMKEMTKNFEEELQSQMQKVSRLTDQLKVAESLSENTDLEYRKLAEENAHNLDVIRRKKAEYENAVAQQTEETKSSQLEISRLMQKLEVTENQLKNNDNSTNLVIDDLKQQIVVQQTLFSQQAANFDQLNVENTQNQGLISTLRVQCDNFVQEKKHFQAELQNQAQVTSRLAHQLEIAESLKLQKHHEHELREQRLLHDIQSLVDQLHSSNKYTGEVLAEKRERVWTLEKRHQNSNREIIRLTASLTKAGHDALQKKKENDEKLAMLNEKIKKLTEELSVDKERFAAYCSSFSGAHYYMQHNG